MKRRLLTLGLILTLCTPATALAQQEPITVDIVYFYQIGPSARSGSEAQESLSILENALRKQRSNDNILIYQGKTDSRDFVALTSGSFSQQTNQSGWIKAFTKDLSLKAPDSRAFVLKSTFLTGQVKLTTDPSSLVVISHVDSDPKQRELNPPLFNQLNQQLTSQPGFKGLQVWTWDARTNHWTVIEAWDSADSRERANRDPRIASLWDDIYKHAAAPKSLETFRLAN